MIIFNSRKPRRSATATVASPIATNAATSTTILAANNRRRYVTISNIAIGTGNNVLVKLQAASVDNVIKGRCIPAGESWDLPTESVYTGEISAISDSGTPSVTVTEY